MRGTNLHNRRAILNYLHSPTGTRVSRLSGQSLEFLLAALLTVTLVSAAFQQHRDYLLSAAISNTDVQLSGLYPWEGTRENSFRWTSGEAILTFPGVIRTQKYQLTLKLAAGPRPTTAPAPGVSITANGVLVDTFEAAPGWTLYRFTLEPDTTARLLDLQVRITVPTFVPRQTIPGNGDSRALGIMVQEVRLQSLGHGLGPFAVPPWDQLLGWTFAAWLGLILISEEGFASSRRMGVAVFLAGELTLAVGLIFAFSQTQGLVWIVFVVLTLAVLGRQLGWGRAIKTPLALQIGRRLGLFADPRTVLHPAGEFDLTARTRAGEARSATGEIATTQNRALATYIPELDGLRAVAILLVLFYHLNFPWLQMGWIGVNLFFVISGFLITGILLDSKPFSHYFRNFYARRVLRIFPIYYLTILIALAFSVLNGVSVQDIGFFLVYMQNYVLAWPGHNTQFLGVFTHTWSLAVEEQFYFIWPFLVYSISRRWLYPLLMAFFVLGALFRFGVLTQFGSAFMATWALPSNLDTLSVGALLALVVRSNQLSQGARRNALWLGLGAALCIVVLILRTGYAQFDTVYFYVLDPVNILLPPLLALLFGSLILVALSYESALSAFLRNSLLRRVGKISYGLYLYHLPIYIIVDSLFAQNAFFLEHAPYVSMVLKLLLTVGIATVSWNLIERRMLALKHHFER